MGLSVAEIALHLREIVPHYGQIDVRLAHYADGRECFWIGGVAHDTEYWVACGSCELDTNEDIESLVEKAHGLREQLDDQLEG